MTNIHILRQLFDVRSISRQSNPLLDFSTYFQPIGYGMSRDENRLKKVKTSALKRGLSQWPGGSGKRPLLEEFACTQRATGLRNGPGLAL